MIQPRSPREEPRSAREVNKSPWFVNLTLKPTARCAMEDSAERKQKVCCQILISGLPSFALQNVQAMGIREGHAGVNGKRLRSPEINKVNK